MKIKIFNNLGVKILSLLAAMILWLAIVNLSDPIITRTFHNIPVEILNENVITEVERVYEVISGDKVDVKVKGKRSIVDNIEDEDFHATADLSELSKVNAVAINVTLNAGKKQRSNVELDWGNEVLQVKLEKKSTATFKVDVKTEGDLDSSYVLGEVNVQPNIIEVSGAESKISTIAGVGVVVMLDGKTENFKANLTPLLYDANGNVITDSGNLVFSTDTIKVTTSISPTKTIPVSFEVSGKPKEGYRLVQTDFQPQTIKVSGRKEELDKLDKIVIPLNIDGEKADIEKQIDVSRYLSGRNVVPVEESKVISVRCVIEKEGRRTFTLSNSDIKVVNLPDNLNFSYEDSGAKYTVVVTGAEEDLKDMNVAKLGAYIDVENLAAGSHKVTLQLMVPDGLKTKSKIKVNIKLVDATENLPEEESTILAPQDDE